MELKNLEINEEKLRDIYLRRLALGEIYGPLTGFPNIDKTWLKYYDESTLTCSLPKMSMYDFLYENNKNHLDEIAIGYFGKEISYKELFDNINIYAQALKSKGIKRGDVVGICMPTTPEAIYLFYAINKIGAVSNLIDVRKSQQDIKYCLNITETKMLFVYDGILDKINGIINETIVENVISVPVTESLGSIMKMLNKGQQLIKSSLSKNKLKQSKSISDFLSSRDKTIDVSESVYSENELSFIEYTSGSTGFPKVVELQGEVANDRVFQYMNNGMEYKRGESYMNIIPIFIAFGAIVGIHLPLCMGLKDDLIAAFNPKKILKLIKKHKPEHTTLTPASYIELIHSRGFNKLDMSNTKTLGCGGDGMNAEEEIEINEKVIEQGSNCLINNGYGGSEIGAPFCTQKDGVIKPGSVGIPLPGNNIIIFDHYTGDILPNNCIGDICMIVNYPMLRYRGNENLTKETLLDLGEGKIGVLLKDAGYVDEDGFLFVKGRYEDAIHKKNNDIVWPVDIENEIMSTRLVKICAVTSSTEGVICHIVLRNSKDKFEFESKLKEIISNYEFTYKINYLKEMYLTSSGKIDRRRLKNIDKKLEKK